MSRVCVDDPMQDICKVIFVIFVPRMRGWSSLIWFPGKISSICPAYAGVILRTLHTSNLSFNLSRVCGSDPGYDFTWQDKSIFVPRIRGWSYSHFSSLQASGICPAYAGMILLALLLVFSLFHLSRVCGGDPILLKKVRVLIGFVPCMRGWSR